MAQDSPHPLEDDVAQRRAVAYDRHRRKRIAANERALRERNREAREEALEAGTPSRAGLEFDCECGTGLCDERLVLSALEYESAHRGGDRYVTAPDHVIRDIERVVERRPGYDVVEKLAQPLAR
jgi:hypothetical protein